MAPHAKTLTISRDIFHDAARAGISADSKNTAPDAIIRVCVTRGAQLKNSTPATSSATTMGKRWPTSISRKSQGGDASEKRYQKAFPKINALSMTS